MVDQVAVDIIRGLVQGRTVNSIEVSGDGGYVVLRISRSKDQEVKTWGQEYELDGESHTVKEWSRILGVSVKTMWSRKSLRGTIFAKKDVAAVTARHRLEREQQKEKSE